MAGHGYVKHDPAIERWNAMRENAYKHFRFTPRTTWKSICGLVLVPAAVFYVAYSNTGQYEWRGKTKGESLLRNPPPAAPAEESED